MISQYQLAQGPTVHFLGADSWALDNLAPEPNCLGPDCPLLGGGQLGTVQLGPGAQLSGAQFAYNPISYLITKIYYYPWIN